MAKFPNSEIIAKVPEYQSNLDTHQWERYNPDSGWIYLKCEHCGFIIYEDAGTGFESAAVLRSEPSWDYDKLTCNQIIIKEILE